MRSDRFFFADGSAYDGISFAEKLRSQHEGAADCAGMEDVEVDVADIKSVERCALEIKITSETSGFLKKNTFNFL